MGPTNDFYRTHNGSKLTKMVDFDRDGWTHITPKKSNDGGPTVGPNYQKRKFLMGIVMLWKNKITVLGNFYLWKVFPTKISKKDNFDGQHM